jgi:GWxTD domain-containing protein
VIVAERFRRLSFLIGFLLVFLSFGSTYAQKATSVSGDPYKKWLNEDVLYIISNQERVDFRKLWTNEQRDRFVTAFWDRRNPVPGSATNTFKIEHYRRLAYANAYYAAGIPGWKTDRGRVYVMQGPPDNISYHPYASNLIARILRGSAAENSKKISYVAEVWHYRNVKGRHLDVSFVDTCQCGEYLLVPNESDPSPEPFSPLY